jgi:hypothetical protein
LLQTKLIFEWKQQDLLGYGKQRANILPWKIEEKIAISVLKAPVYSSPNIVLNKLNC